MALTTAQPGLTPNQWDDKFFTDYVRESRFKKYMGTDENSIIQLKEDLTKKKGDRITIALVNELKGAGVTGNATLEGNEEALGSRSHQIAVAPLRHAVAITEWDEQKSVIDLRNAAKTMLKMWAMTKMRDAIIGALASINNVPYATSTAAQRNEWLADNADRVLFGAAKSNNAGNVHATSLANVDNTNDKLTPAAISLLKRMAQTASPKIRPIRLSEDEEWYVMFAGPRAFRDLANNTVMQQANRDARTRGTDNPLFTGGALIWDGVIIREIPEIGVLTAVGTDPDGAGALLPIDVEPAYLCGAQALGIAWAQRTKSKTDVRDYDFIHGVAMSEIRGVDKLTFGTGVGDLDDQKDNGVATGYFAAVADA